MGMSSSVFISSPKHSSKSLFQDQYVLYQGKRVGEVDDDRLKFEVSTIVSREGLEMHMCSFADKSEEVKFAVPLLDMNINKMVSGCPWKQLQKIYLQVVYPVGRKYMSASSAPRLKLVSSFELKALYSVDDVKLPSWLDGMCLAEYLPNLEEYLEKQVLEAVSLIDVRRRFIEALAVPLGRPVEADPVFCRKATFLSASGVFTFLLEHMGSASDASVLLIQQLASVSKPLVTKVCAAHDGGDHRRVEPLS
ncbi:hypothetical protein L195_g022677 [Trifolium pratense]|uniref:BRISC and BRCA1-A complex member 2 n=1 Tax=Trifolium pratense TaxID=57577 RepID=A0A2K3N8Q1_TRIPR|nr:hypothetical protein L195_g022677 [Trifolium pratense]